MIKIRLACLLLLCLPIELLATQEYVSGYPAANTYYNAPAAQPAPQNYTSNNPGYNNYPSQPNAYANNAPAVNPAYGSARPMPPNPYANNPYMANSPASAYAAGSQPANAGAGSAPAANNGLPPGMNPTTGQPTASAQAPASNSSAPAGYNPSAPTASQAPGVAAQQVPTNTNGSSPATANPASASTLPPQAAQNPANTYNNGAASNAGSSVYSDQEKQAWLNSCVPSASAPSVARVAQAFCLCGWQHISSGELPANLLTSTNPADIQQRQSIMQAISEACVVQLTASNQIQ